MKVTQEALDLIAKKGTFEELFFGPYGKRGVFRFNPHKTDETPTEDFPEIQENMSEEEMVTIALERGLSDNERRIFWMKYPCWFI